MLNKTFTINKLLILLLLFGLSIPYTVSAQLSETAPWPRFHNDMRNSGYTKNFGTAIGKKRWLARTGGEVISSPAIDENGIVYFGSADNNFYAVDGETGQILWTYKTDGPIGLSSPAIDANGIVYVGSGDGYLYAFDTETIDPTDQTTQVPKWKFKTGNPPYFITAIDSSPNIDLAGNIYFTSTDGYLYCINSSGTEVWKSQIGLSIVSPAIDAVDSVLYVGAWFASSCTGSVWVVDNATTGAGHFDSIIGPCSLHTFDLNGTYLDGWPVYHCNPGGMRASPVITQDQGYIASYFMSNDDDDCDDEHEFNFYTFPPSGYGKKIDYNGENIYSTPALLPDGSIFIGAGNAFARIHPDFAQYYESQIEGDFTESSPAIDGKLHAYIGSLGGKFYCVSALMPQNKEVWVYDYLEDQELNTGEVIEFESSPAIGNDERHTIYVGSNKGLFAFYDGARISGTVELVETLDNGTISKKPLAGVTITLSSDDLEGTLQTTTDPSGYYFFAGVENLTYSVNAEKIGFIFNQKTLSVTVRNDKDVSNVNFEASGGKTLTGTISYSSGSGVANVQVKIENTDLSVSETEFTDVSGKFQFDGLSFDTYTVTPSKTEHGFTPPYRKVSIGATDSSLLNYTANFTATEGFQISGTVIDDTTNLGIIGATITLKGSGLPETTRTDLNGAYNFVELEPDTYTITAVYLNYKFSPTTVTKTIVSANVDNVDFHAATGATVNGYIFEGTTPIATETTVELYTILEYLTNAEPSRTAVTNENGFYSIIGIANGLYIIKPVLDGYSFDPVTTFITLLDNDQNDINFRGITGLSISGKVSNIFGLPYADITISLSGSITGETTTDSSGQYIFTALTAGLYTVSVSNDFYDISPESIPVDVTTSNIESKNFTASPICPVVYLNIPFFGGEGTLVNIYGINFEDRDQSNDTTLVTIGDTGVSVSPGVYFGYEDPSTWIKADVEQWQSGRILAYAPGGLGFYNIFVVIVDEDGNGCVYQNSYPTNFFLSY